MLCPIKYKIKSISIASLIFFLASFLITSALYTVENRTENLESHNSVVQTEASCHKKVINQQNLIITKLEGLENKL